MSKYASTEIKIESGEEHLIMRESEVLRILNGAVRVAAA